MITENMTDMSEVRPALVTTDHVAIIMLEVTNTPCHAALIVIFTFICTRCVWVLALSYHRRVARHILYVYKCSQLV